MKYAIHETYTSDDARENELASRILRTAKKLDMPELNSFLSAMIASPVDDWEAYNRKRREDEQAAQKAIASFNVSAQPQYTPEEVAAYSRCVGSYVTARLAELDALEAERTADVVEHPAFTQLRFDESA